MRFSVDPWDPSYGASLDTELGESEAETTVDVECPPERWRPLDPDPAVRAPATVLFVDGIRRVDAQLWVEERPGEASPALCGSWAAGVVCCCPDGAHLGGADVRRGLFTSAPGAADVVTAAGAYTAHRLEPGKAAGAGQRLSAALQAALRRTELEVALAARERRACRTDADDDLLVLDGSVQGRQHLPRTVGFTKTHSQTYLPATLGGIVARLDTGQRTPVFRIDGPWRRHTWYLRLPCAPAGPWAGVVRVECSADLPVAEAVALAARSQVTLVRYASAEYKDSRAPQNLYPIAGLERALRRRLGEQALLYRALRRSASDVTTVTPMPA